MKALSKEYGYAALGVYLGLSALDFPFCFLFVKWVGTERVGEWEEKIVGAVKPWWESAREKIGFPVKRETRGEKEVEAEREERREGLKGASEFFIPSAMWKGEGGGGWVIGIGRAEVRE